jgi:hypothetical protein
MSNKEYKIEVIDAPTNEVIEKDKDEKSWFYKNIGVAVNEFDKQDKLEKASIKEEEYKKYWDGLTEGERFAITRDQTMDEGRPESMTVDTWESLPTWKRAWYVGLRDPNDFVRGPIETGFNVTKGAAMGLTDILVNTFSLPLEVADVLNDTNAAEEFKKAVEYIDPLEPENTTQAITSVLTQYGAPAISVVNWLNKFSKAPGFWNALGRYVRNIGAVGVTDSIVSGPADTNLATAFGDNYPVPFEQLLTIHEDDPSLVRRVKIGSEMAYVGPIVDTALMIGGGLYRTGRFLTGNADTTKKIEYTDLNGDIQSFYASERTFNAVSKILNDMSSGPRTLEEINATIKLFQGSGIIPPTGAASGSPGLIHLGKLFNSGSYSDVTVRNLLAMNENMDTLLKANGLSDGINSKFLSKEIDARLNDINARIASKTETIENLKGERTGAVSEAQAKLVENQSILKLDLENLRTERKTIEAQVKETFTNDFNAAKEEVLAYLQQVGSFNPGTANQLAHNLDDELINQFAYLTYYKNQLYKNIDVDPNTQTKIVHNLKKMNVGDKDTVFSLLKSDIDNFVKKKDAYDTVVKRIPNDLMNELKTLINPKNKGDLTLSRLEETRALFSKAYKEAIDAGDTVLAERIRASKHQIFTNLYENISKNTEFSGMADRASAASQWFKTEYAPRFEEGVGSMWAEAFKKRKSGSIYSSSPEQSPLFFLKNDGKGLYINNSSEAGINQLENILNPPKSADGKPLVEEFVDANGNKLNLADKENAVKIVENFFAAKLAQLLSSSSTVPRSLQILDKFQLDYNPILQKYPSIAKQIEEYRTTIKEKNAEVITAGDAKKSSELAEKENTINQLSNQKDLIEQSKLRDQKNIDSVNASFSEKIDIATEELKLISNEKNNNLNLFSFFINDNPVNAINKAMNSKNPEEALAAIREEVNALNVPEATKGLNEAVSQWLKTQIQTKTRIPTTENVKYQADGQKYKFAADLEGLDSILSNPDKVKALEAAGFGADDIATLGKFSDQLIIIEREFLDAKGGSKAEITDPAQVGRKAQILAASIYGIVKGRGIMALMNLMGGALGISPMKAQSLLLQDAMTHPELAKILLKEETEQSLNLLKGYITNNYGNIPDAKKEFEENDIEYNIQELEQFNIEPVSQLNTLPDPVNVNVPTANPASRLASANFVSPIAENPAMAMNQGTGNIDPNRAALAFGPNDMLAQPRMAAQGGIMNARKPIQRVA